MAVIAIAVFVVAYVLIASDRVNKTLVALVGAGAVVVLGVVESADAFYSHETGIDWDVIFLLLGMMIIVGVLRQTGIFEYIAIWSVKRAKGSPLRIMVLLVLITALASALLDNVTTVLLVAPVTLLLCERLALDPVPFLLAEVMASNIGGTSTLIGDPPNIIIGSRADLGFNDFLVHLAPIVLVLVAAFVGLCWLLWGRGMRHDAERAEAVMALTAGETITDRRLLARVGVVLALVLVGFVTHPVTHLDPSLVALLGAGASILVSGVDHPVYLEEVEWETLLFFAGLFVMVGSL